MNERKNQPWPVYECPPDSNGEMRVCSREKAFEVIYHAPTGGRSYGWVEIVFFDGSCKAFDIVSGIKLWSKEKK